MNSDREEIEQKLAIDRNILIEGRKVNILIGEKFSDREEEEKLRHINKHVKSWTKKPFSPYFSYFVLFHIFF